MGERMGIRESLPAYSRQGNLRARRARLIKAKHPPSRWLRRGRRMSKDKKIEFRLIPIIGAKSYGTVVTS